jgi:hypothetical protein
MRSAQARCSRAAARLPLSNTARSLIRTAATGGCGALASTLERLAAEHAAVLNVALGAGRFGLCLTNKSSAAAAAPPPSGEPQLAIRVPLALVLSDEVPGCSPAARAAAPLQRVLQQLRSVEDIDRWELRLAAMLLWAVRQLDAPAGSFWGRWVRAWRGPGARRWLDQRHPSVHRPRPALLTTARASNFAGTPRSCPASASRPPC